jgi:hypothetical protein
MGNLTFFIKSINCAKSAFINWNNVDKEIIENGFPYINFDNNFKKKVKTLHDLGCYFSNSNFFGYFDNSTIEKFIHICKNININFEDSTPRLYFEESDFDRLHFIEFNPKNKNVIYGYKDFDEDEDIDEVIDNPEDWKIIKLKNYHVFDEDDIFNLYSDIDYYNIDPHRQIDLIRKKIQNVY